MTTEERKRRAERDGDRSRAALEATRQGLPSDPLPHPGAPTMETLVALMECALGPEEHRATEGHLRGCRACYDRAWFQAGCYARSHAYTFHFSPPEPNGTGG